MKRLIPATVALMLVLAVGSNPATAKVNSSAVEGACPVPFGEPEPHRDLPAGLTADRDGNGFVCSMMIARRRPDTRTTLWIDDVIPTH